jgi:transcriptional regulator with XRE-family HTH domain
MDLVRFGIVIRALRRRRGWRQLDLAAAASISQDTISLIERGHGDRMSVATLMRVAGALDARVRIDIRWRGGDLDRLIDQDHAALAAEVARILELAGWAVMIEVTYSVYGEHGSIDVLAWHQASGSLLVIEIKTEVTSSEATIRKLDEKVRLAANLARERFGWAASSVSRLLVVEDSATARDRIEAGGSLFALAFPSRTVAVRRWLRAPSGRLSGLMFLRNTNQHRHMSARGGRHRVRQPRERMRDVGTSVATAPGAAEEPEPSITILTNRRYDDAGS